MDTRKNRVQAGSGSGGARVQLAACANRQLHPLAARVSAGSNCPERQVQGATGRRR